MHDYDKAWTSLSLARRVKYRWLAFKYNTWARWNTRKWKFQKKLRVWQFTYVRWQSKIANKLRCRRLGLTTLANKEITTCPDRVTDWFDDMLEQGRIHREQIVFVWRANNRTMFATNRFYAKTIHIPAGQSVTVYGENIPGWNSMGDWLSTGTARWGLMTKNKSLQTQFRLVS